jgi:hypothetical protein
VGSPYKYPSYKIAIQHRTLANKHIITTCSGDGAPSVRPPRSLAREPRRDSVGYSRKRGPKSGARSFPEWRIFSHNELGDIFLMTRARHCSKLTKASHAQRTPLNMGALHCVTDNHMHIYTARTSGEVKDMRRPLRFRTSTRGFATTVELQQAMSRGPVLARRLRRRQGGNRRELRGRGSATVERWWLRVEQPHAPAACASWQPHHATRRCSSTMS